MSIEGNNELVNNLAEELVINGPIHIDQIPSTSDQTVGLSRSALAPIIANGWAHYILVKGKPGWVAATAANPFYKP